jgi:hypothetical protein
MHSRSDGSPRIALRITEFDRACQDQGLEGPKARGEFLGVQHTTVSRVMQGATGPGERFIAATLSAFAAHKFEDLFEVLPASERAHARNTRKAS